MNQESFKNENIIELVKKLLESLNVSKYGFADLTDLVPKQYSNLTTGISFAIRLSDVVIDEITDFEPTHTYFHHYRSVNSFIDHVALRVVMLLQKYGVKAVAIPSSQSINTESYDYSGVFQHRTAATNAGLGWIGKNGSLITPEFGPRIRLGTILTNMSVEYNKPVLTSKCGSCNLCVIKCPCLALTGNEWIRGMERKNVVDAKVCSKHMSTKYKHIGRGVVCGICIRSCRIGTERLI